MIQLKQARMANTTGHFHTAAAPTRFPPNPAAVNAHLPYVDFIIEVNILFAKPRSDYAPQRFWFLPSVAAAS